MLGFLQSKDNRKERKKSSKGGRRSGSGRKRKAGTAEHQKGHCAACAEEDQS
jgi:hypothetical protein